VDFAHYVKTTLFLDEGRTPIFYLLVKENTWIRASETETRQAKIGQFDAQRGAW